jgi:hypothetical protein
MDDARACLSAVEASGLTLASWARRMDVDGRSLNAWRMNFARGGDVAPPTAVRLVELVAPPPVAAARYVVRCGDLAVEVSDGFDDQTLLRLLRVVSSC